jgi:hypothetical protein
MDQKTKELRAALKPVGDPYDWENNDDYMHPDNFKIRLFNMLDDTQSYIKSGKTKRRIRPASELLKELKEMEQYEQ